MGPAHHDHGGRPVRGLHHKSEIPDQPISDSRRRARFEVADLEQPLFMAPDASFDLAVASLVLHYIQDWRPLLAELRRCLVPTGVLIFSIHHPITGWQLSGQEDYHRTELISEQWDWDGQPVTAQMYRRPISAIFSQLRAGGFTVDVVAEPQPEAAGRTSDPRVMQILRTQPVFLFIRAVRASAVPPGEPQRSLLNSQITPQTRAQR